MTTPTEVRRRRICEVCLQVDDHPRHLEEVMDGTAAVLTFEQLNSLPENTPPAAVAEVQDPTTRLHHIDCGAASGCVTCGDTLVFVGDAKGDKLLKKLQSGAADALNTPVDMSATTAEEA